MERHRTEESSAINEFEIATKQLKSAYAAVLNKFTRIAKNPSLKMNPSDQELAELDAAQDRFDKARLQMDIIINEIRKGARI
jgi:hypothetical protein